MGLPAGLPLLLAIPAACAPGPRTQVKLPDMNVLLFD
jgi:hypothetical protein